MVDNDLKLEFEKYILNSNYLRDLDLSKLENGCYDSNETHHHLMTFYAGCFYGMNRTSAIISEYNT